MKIDNTKENRESWRALESALGRAQCMDFMWMGSAGSVQLYKHMDTRRYLKIDAQTGVFYDEDGQPLNREAAINSVLS